MGSELFCIKLCTASCFPDKAVLHIILILGKLETFVKLEGQVGCLDRTLCRTCVPANRLNVNTAFNHVLNFPVSTFSASFVVVAENRLVFVVRSNASPAIV